MLDNICAIATPYGTGAISIIRCSGPRAIEYVNNVFKGKNLNKCESHTIHYGYILDGKDINKFRLYSKCDIYFQYTTTTEDLINNLPFSLKVLI